MGVDAEGQPSAPEGAHVPAPAAAAGALGEAPAAPEPGGGPPEYTDLIGTRGRVAVGVLFFVLYTLTFGLRGSMLAGLVGGALGGVLFFLLLKEAEERRRRRLRRRG